MMLHAHRHQGTAIEQLKKICEIRLDGIAQEGVIACDTRESFCLRYRMLDGRYVVAPGGDTVALEALEGKVTIHFK